MWSPGRAPSHGQKTSCKAFASESGRIESGPALDTVDAIGCNFAECWSACWVRLPNALVRKITDSILGWGLRMWAVGHCLLGKVSMRVRRSKETPPVELTSGP